MSFVEKLEALCEKYPVVGPKAGYGTAGFRGKPDELKHIMQRCGLLATLRSYMLCCKAVGCMITASHNPASDNGIKLIDPDGGMLGQNFELYAQVMANCPAPAQYVMKICRELNPDAEVDDEFFAHTTVMIGRDTRSSSLELSEILAEAVRAMGGKVIDFGELTTPQLHFLVGRANSETMEADHMVKEEEYFNILASRVMNFCQASELKIEQPSTLYFDCSNGVGASKIAQFEPVLQMIGCTAAIRNTGKEVMDVLNEECGAEYIHQNKKFPRCFEVSELKGSRAVSFDGDADRLVYFKASESSGDLILCDGDRMAALFKRMIEELLLRVVKEFPTKSEKVLHLGVVQTAYTNGAASAVMMTPPEGLALLDCPDIVYHYDTVKTGVKHLHSKAETYGVGLYFEANGHGTIISDFEILDEWAKLKECKDSKEFATLRAFLSIFNQTIGDAMANTFAVEASLQYLKMDVEEWYSMYEDLPALNRSIPLPRLRLKQIRPSDADETVLIRPPEMQKEISSLLTDPERAFVRPSGTEDVLRLYVEANTLEDAVTLAGKVEDVVKKYCAA